MSEEQPPRVKLLQFALEGERVRKAAAVLEGEAVRLVAGLRRAAPFLAKRGVPVSLVNAKATPIADLIASLTQPIHTTHLKASPGDAYGALVLDANAIALFLDGVLGGDGQSLPVLSGPSLSVAQAALVGGVSEGIVTALSDALFGSIGVRLEKARASFDQAATETTPIAVTLAIGDGEQGGRAVLLLAREVLLRGVGGSEPRRDAEPDPRIVGTLQGIELDLVAELGRIPMRLSELGRLRVGDTLRLDLQVGGTVSIRANGSELLRGRPTTNEGRIAIRLDRRHEG